MVVSATVIGTRLQSTQSTSTKIEDYLRKKKGKKRNKGRKDGAKEGRRGKGKREKQKGERKLS
jgi:hypothetical protein